VTGLVWSHGVYQLSSSDSASANIVNDRIHACPACTESWSDVRYEASGREHPTYRVPFEEVFDG